MILDHLDNADRYAALHPGFARGFDFLRNAMTAVPSPGRHELDGQRLFVMVADEQAKGRAAAKLEVHRRYIDIQMILPSSSTTAKSERTSAIEQIGWRPLKDCKDPESPFDESRDIRFFHDRPETWLVLPFGVFAIFYPEDAHAPLAGDSPLRKAIVKIALNW
jgi:YhcH/YjgK/YiaL family protein